MGQVFQHECRQHCIERPVRKWKGDRITGNGLNVQRLPRCPWARERDTAERRIQGNTIPGMP